MSALPASLSLDAPVELTSGGSVIWANATALGMSMTAIEANDLAERVGPIFRDLGAFDALLKSARETRGEAA